MRVFLYGCKRVSEVAGQVRVLELAVVTDLVTFGTVKGSRDTIRTQHFTTGVGQT